ncbi:hypothetical protein OCU04_004477 [Sclerotinia nivalis]|uniref:Uncharacterized protein n=1 Tax=Sclerotinia nivalis TaxID=352851 RepID=A0A9X0AQH8_9HELO|nr:hypothetical protein OCU04_004477 [Sclerotinia nivalis]
MNRTDNLMDKPDTMSNEETETSDIVENPAPGSPIPQGSVRDEIAIAAENGVNEREDGSGSLEAGQGVTDIENKDGDEEEAENKDCVPLAFVKASEYCLLCRARFPVFDSINQPNRVLYYKWRSKNPDEPWQSQIRAVVQLDKDEGESIAVTDVVELKRNPTKATLIGWPSSSHISIKPDPMLDDPIDQLASCFHDWCYSIFTWEFGHDNLELLYQMGTSLQPASAWQMPAEMKGPLYPQVNCDNLLSGVDSKTAMFQPLQIAKLPPEIRCRIWNFVGPTSAYSAFMILIGETSTLARQMRAPAVRELAIKPGYYLEPSIINMYGTQYIQALVTQKDSSLGVKVVGTVTKIQVVSSVHGVCSIRLLGRNWESKWLGTIPRMGPRWYGEITLENNVLVCFYNGLAIEEVAGNHQPHMRQVMWDRPDHPGAAFDADGALFTFFAPQELYRRIQPVLGFFRFIPLTAGDVYASGITVHFLSRFMTGIEAHFSTTSHLVGSRSEMAVYFPLASSERISNVWLRFDTFAATASAPSMLVSIYISWLQMQCLMYLDPHDAGSGLYLRPIH